MFLEREREREREREYRERERESIERERERSCGGELSCGSRGTPPRRHMLQAAHVASGSRGTRLTRHTALTALTFTLVNASCAYTKHSRFHFSLLVRTYALTQDNARAARESVREGGSERAGCSLLTRRNDTGTGRKEKFSVVKGGSIPLLILLVFSLLPLSLS